MRFSRATQFIAFSVGIMWLACGSSSGKASFCDSVSSSPGCPNDTKGCNEAVAITENMYPHCQAIYDAFLQCTTELRKSCQGRTIVAVGDGAVRNEYGTYSGPVFDVEVKDSQCGQHIASMRSCELCSAPMADVTTPLVAPIGGLCSATVACASGLRCDQGVCTKSCSTQSDCERCSDLHGQFCHAGTCKPSCAGQGVTCDHLPNHTCNGHNAGGALLYVCEPK
jgi:hypothetical protein